MNHIVANTVTRHTCRRHGSGGQHHCDAPPAYLLDQRNNRIGFADTCSMKPDQRTVWASDAGAAIALLAAAAFFLALGRANRQIGTQQRVNAGPNQR
jgi:hypothetical protein